jgi:TPR repeat protein
VSIEGDAVRQAHYQRCVMQGIGVSQSETEGAEYFKLSADQGHSDGQYRSGRCLMKGNGVTPDSADAVKYFQLSVDNVHKKAYHYRA